jgi:hypothetical protein
MMQMTSGAATTTPQYRQKCHDSDNHSMMQTTGDNADNDDGDDNAADDADVNTDDNATAQTMDNNANNNAWEVKTVGGTSEVKTRIGG